MNPQPIVVVPYSTYCINQLVQTYPSFFMGLFIVLVVGLAAYVIYNVFKKN